MDGLDLRLQTKESRTKWESSYVNAYIAQALQVRTSRDQVKMLRFVSDKFIYLVFLSDLKHIYMCACVCTRAREWMCVLYIDSKILSANHFEFDVLMFSDDEWCLFCNRHCTQKKFILIFLFLDC